MKIGKTLLSLLVVISILAAFLTNTYAAGNDKLELELRVGSTSAKVNGTESKVEKPYMVNNSAMVPLEWITTAVGAEVNK